MNNLKKILFITFAPIITLICLIIFKGIWGLKKYLYSQDAPNSLLVKVYDSYFERYGSWIGHNCDLLDVPCFPHGFFGIFISGGAKIGKNVVIFHHVTIGSNTLNHSNNFGSPIIGDNTYIGAGAKIIGKVIIGENCRIGANAVVYKDMPPNSVAVQSPTRIIQKQQLDNRYYSRRNGKWVYFKDGNWIEEADGETIGLNYTLYAFHSFKTLKVKR